jgi:hypothetical protein
MIAESEKTSLRVNHMIDLKAYVKYFDVAEEVANFNLELSLKTLAPRANRRA